MKTLEYELTRALEGRASAVAALMGLQLDAEAQASASGSAPKAAASEASMVGAEELPESYTRYLVNGLRDDFGMPGVPIRLMLRSGENPYAKKK